MMHTRTQASYKELRVAKEKAERDLMLYKQPAFPRSQFEEAKVNELELMEMKKKLVEKDLKISALTEALNACFITNGLEQAVMGINFESALKKSRSELKYLKHEFDTYRKTAEEKAFQNDMKLKSTSNTLQAELAAKLMTQTAEFNAFREVSQKEVAARKKLEIWEFELERMREANISEDEKLATLREKLEEISSDVMTYQLAQKQLQSDLAGKDTELTDLREKLKASNMIAEKEDEATEKVHVVKLALKQVLNENDQKDAKLAELTKQLRLSDRQALKLKKLQSELPAKGYEQRSLVTQLNESKSKAKQVVNKTKFELDTKDAELHTLKNNHDHHWKDVELHHESVSKKQKKLKVMLAGMMYRTNGILELAKVTINEDHRDDLLKDEVQEEEDVFCSFESEDVFENFSDEELEAMYQLVSSPDEDETKIMSDIFKSIMMARRGFNLYTSASPLYFQLMNASLNFSLQKMELHFDLMMSP